MRLLPLNLDYEFFTETVNIQDSAHTDQIKNENSDWSLTLPSNGIPVSYKIDTGAQCLTILKKFDPEPDLCPVNIKLSAYNNSKISILGKCSLTEKHKKDHLCFVYCSRLKFLAYCRISNQRKFKPDKPESLNVFLP